MKVYRKTVFKHIHLLVFVFLMLFFVYYKIAFGYNNLIFACFFLFTFVCFLLIARYCCYLVVDEEKLVIKNSVYWFWSKTYPYEEIAKIYFNIAPNMNRGEYLRIVSTQQKTKRYFLECVKTSDYAAIVSDLQSYGVDIEVDKYIKRRYIKD